MKHTENAEYSMLQGEVHSLSDNPIVRAVEIPTAAAVDQAGNSTHARNFIGDVAFATVQCFYLLLWFGHNEVDILGLTTTVSTVPWNKTFLGNRSFSVTCPGVELVASFVAFSGWLQVPSVNNTFVYIWHTASFYLID